MNVERAITAVFDIEILWRFIATSPQWRNFILKKRNVADLVLALVCTIIVIPPIPNTEAYKWLTAFQLARFYRAILIVPGMHSLLVSVQITATPNDLNPCLVQSLRQLERPLQHVCVSLARQFPGRSLRHPTLSG